LVAEAAALVLQILQENSGDDAFAKRSEVCPTQLLNIA